MVLAAGSDVRADPVAPYTDPLFAAECTVHHFAEGEAPPLDGLPDDPLCVEYDKRDITATDGGAIRFLAAEPARFAVAVPKCRYWQQDHWSVQVAPGTTSIVHWDGSYWFDKGNVTCVAHVADDEVAGGQLPVACRANVERCASRSTCGRAGHVTCCRTSATGSTTCAIKRSASCRAPRGGRACVGTEASCCDACGASGCS